MKTATLPEKVGSLMAVDLKRPFRLTESFLGKCDPETPVYIFVQDARLVWMVQSGRMVLTQKPEDAHGLAETELAMTVRFGDLQAAIKDLGSTSQVVDIYCNEQRLILVGANDRSHNIELIDTGLPPIRFPSEGAVDVPCEISDYTIKHLTKGLPKFPVFVQSANKGQRFILKCDNRTRTGCFFDPVAKGGDISPKRINLRFGHDEIKRLGRINEHKGRGILTVYTSDNSCLWSWRQNYKTGGSVEVHVAPYVEKEPLTGDAGMKLGQRLRAQHGVPAASEDERARLVELEQVVSDGLEIFYKVGAALKEIRDAKLYRVGGHQTFDDYTRDRWAMERTYAHRHIEAAELRDNLLPIGNIPLPQNEAQARPLSKLEPADQQDAWQTVLERAPKDSDGKPKITAKLVREVADEVIGNGSVDGDESAWNMEAAIDEFSSYVEKTWAKWPKESLDVLLMQLQRFVLKVQKEVNDGDNEPASIREASK